jgi:hypothetical protein
MRRASAARTSGATRSAVRAKGRPWLTRLADHVGGQAGREAGGDEALLGRVGRRGALGGERRGRDDLGARSRRRRGRRDGEGLDGGRRGLGDRRRVGDEVLRRHREHVRDGGSRRRGGGRGGLRAVEPGRHGGGRRGLPRDGDLAPGGREQDLPGAIGDRALRAGEGVRERRGLLDQRLDAGCAQALRGGAVVAGLQRQLAGLAAARVHLDERALEEAAETAREALAAAQHDGVGTELLADPREQLLERPASEGLHVALHLRSHRHAARKREAGGQHAGRRAAGLRPPRWTRPWRRRGR